MKVSDEHKEELDALRKDSEKTNKLHVAALLETIEFLNEKSQSVEKELKTHNETITKISAKNKELEEKVEHLLMKNACLDSREQSLDEKLRRKCQFVYEFIEKLKCETDNLCKTEEYSEINDLMIHPKTEVNDDKKIEQEASYTSERNINRTKIEMESSVTPKKRRKH